MKKVAWILFAALAMALSSGAASAQTARTFISGVGSDQNNCSRTAPCRSFAQALSVTAAGGEVVVLDSAGYGPFTISQGVTISAQNVEAAITPAASGDGNGIDIAAPSGSVVTLNGLVLTGGGGGNNGINFTGGGTLNIENCVVRGFAGDGLMLGAAATVTVSDTVISDNQNYGVVLTPAGAASASFERVQLTGNTNGLNLFAGNAGGGAIVASVEDSIVAGSSHTGVLAQAQTTLLLSNSQVFNNKYGLDVSGTANLAHVTIFGNTTDGYIVDSGGTIDSFRTTVNSTNYNGNYIADTTNVGTLTTAAPQ